MCFDNLKDITAFPQLEETTPRSLLFFFHPKISKRFKNRAVLYTSRIVLCFFFFFFTTTRTNTWLSWVHTQFSIVHLSSGCCRVIYITKRSSGRLLTGYNITGRRRTVRWNNARRYAMKQAVHRKTHGEGSALTTDRPCWRGGKLLWTDSLLPTFMCDLSVFLLYTQVWWGRESTGSTARGERAEIHVSRESKIGFF
jgi:hypothetical protein